MKGMLRLDSHKYTVLYRGMFYQVYVEKHPGERDWYYAEVIFTKDILPEEEVKWFFQKPDKHELSNGRYRYIHKRPGALNQLDPRSLDSYYIDLPMGGKIPDDCTAYACWDYQHGFDDVYYHDLESVKRDCETAIDWILQHMRIKVRCHYCDQYGYPDEEGWIDPGFGMWPPIHPECEKKRVAELLAEGKDAHANPIKQEEE